MAHARKWFGIRVPLSLDQLDAFDPFRDAHPEHVLANFDRMAILVDNFFDEVEIGYGHEEEGQTEAPSMFPKRGSRTRTPACFGNNRVKETRLYTTPMGRGIGDVFRQRKLFGNAKIQRLVVWYTTKNKEATKLAEPFLHQKERLFLEALVLQHSRRL